jgi:hypothetical protein
MARPASDVHGKLGRFGCCQFHLMTGIVMMFLAAAHVPVFMMLIFEFISCLSDTAPDSTFFAFCYGGACVGTLLWLGLLFFIVEWALFTRRRAGQK